MDGTPAQEARLARDAQEWGDRVTLSEAQCYEKKDEKDFEYLNGHGDQAEVKLVYSPKANAERLRLVADVVDALRSATTEQELRDAVARLSPADSKAVRRLAATAEGKKAYVEKQREVRRVVNAVGDVHYEPDGFIPVKPDIGSKAMEAEKRMQRFDQEVGQLVAGGLTVRAARKKWFDDETERRVGRPRRPKEYEDSKFDDMREDKVCAPIYAKLRAAKEAKASKTN